jgi:hypothetical protein
MVNGGVLYSNGSVKGGATQTELNNLREAALGQYYYTPQAEAYLRSLPLSYGNLPADAQKTALGTWNGPQEGVKINPVVMPYDPGSSYDAGSTTPVNTLTHEYMHALDSNLNAGYDATMNPNGANSADSQNFYPESQKRLPLKTKQELNKFLSLYQRNPYVNDTESFAQFAAPQGSNVLLTPEAQRYNQIFVPATRKPRAIYDYPTQYTAGSGPMIPGVPTAGRSPGGGVGGFYPIGGK